MADDHKKAHDSKTGSQKRKFVAILALLALLIIVAVWVFADVEKRTEDHHNRTIASDDNTKRGADSSSDGQVGPDAHTPARASGSNRALDSNTSQSSSTSANPEVAQPSTPLPTQSAETPDDRVPFQVTISGIVVDLKSMPISGASVDALSPEPDGERGHAQEGGGWSSRVRATGSELTGSATTNTEGRFTITLTGQRPAGAEQATVALRASADGYANAESIALEIAHNGTRDNVRLMLFPAGSIFGVVMTEHNDMPIAGALVDVHHMGENYIAPKGSTNPDIGQTRADIELSTTADAEGRFRVNGLMPGGYFVRARNPQPAGDQIVGGPTPPAYGASENVRLVGAEQGPVELRIPALSTLRFRIDAAQGVNAAVGVTLREATNFQFPGLGTLIAPNGEGVYEAPWLMAKHSSVGIKAQGFAQTFFSIQPVAGEDLDLGTITLKAGAEFIGRVQDDSGRPIAGAHVFLKDDILMPFSGAEERKPMLAEAHSNDQGLFRMLGVENGSYALTCEHPDYATYRGKAQVGHQRAPADLVITLSRGAVVFGRVAPPPAGAVADPTGLLDRNRVALVPVSTFRVLHAYQFDEGFLGFLIEDATHRADVGEDGSFELTGLPPDEYLAIAVYRGRADKVPGVVLKAGDRRRIDFDFASEEGSVRGIVTFKGEAQAGVQMRLARNLGARGPGTSITTTTGSDGSYRFDDVVEGSFFIGTNKDPSSLSAAELALRAVRVIRGETVTLNIELKVARPGATLEGRVTLGGEALFKQVRVVPVGVPAATTLSAAITDGSGFSVDGLLPGKWQVWLLGRRGTGNWFHALHLLDVQADDESLKLEHDFEAANLKGQVRLPEGAAMPDKGVAVRLEPCDAQGTGLKTPTGIAGCEVRTNSDGAFVFDTLASGQYQLTATLPGHASTRSIVEVRSGASVDISIQSQPLGVLELVIAKIEGFSGSEAEVWRRLTATVTDHAGESSSQLLVVRPNSARTNRFEVLPGAAEVVLRGEDFEPLRYTVDITLAETRRVEVTLRRAASCVVSFTGDAQPDASFIEALQKAEVRVRDADGREQWLAATPAALLAQGKLKLSPLKAGSYQVEITISGYAKQELTIQVTEMQESTQSLTLTPEERSRARSQAKTKLKSASK